MKIDNFSLIIKVSNRQYNLKKVIKYYGNLKCEKIIIDHSSQKYSDIGSLEAAGFKYLYYSLDINYFDVSIDALKDVTNSFMLDCADDDYSLKSSILDSVNFLSKNNDYVTCDGLYTNSISHRKSLRVKYPGSFYKFDLHNSDDIYDRIFKFFTRDYYYALCHTVIKTSVYKKIFEVISGDSNIKIQANAYDRFFTFIALLHGKHKILPNLYCIKKYTKKVYMQPGHGNRWKTNPLRNEIYNKEWLNILNLLYMEKTCLSYEKSFDLISSILYNHYYAPAASLRGSGAYNIIRNNKEANLIKSLMWKKGGK